MRVFDAESPGRLDVRTEELTETNDWALLEKTFAASRHQSQSSGRAPRETAANWPHRRVNPAMTNTALTPACILAQRREAETDIAVNLSDARTFCGINWLSSVIFSSWIY